LLDGAKRIGGLDTPEMPVIAFAAFVVVPDLADIRTTAIGASGRYYG